MQLLPNSLRFLKLAKQQELFVWRSFYSCLIPYYKSKTQQNFPLK